MAFVEVRCDEHDELLGRLTASKDRLDQEWRQYGLEAGREWARKFAEYDTLDNIYKYFDGTTDDEWDSVLSESLSDKHTAAERMAFAICPEINGNQIGSSEFWNEVFGEEDGGYALHMSRPQTLRGFVEGSLEVFNTVREAL